MFKKVLAAVAIAMFFFGGLSTHHLDAGAPVWKGPKGAIPEEPFWPHAKAMSLNAKWKQQIIDWKWDWKFRKYKGYSSANLKK